MATEFKSQICTTVEQSDRLLGLGLKPETADMHYLWGGYWHPVLEDWAHAVGDYPFDFEGEEEQGEWELRHHPAWSLHRLIEMMPFDVIPEGGFDNCFTLIKNYPQGYSVEYDGFSYYYKENIYDTLIDAIEHLISERYFNKEYLV